MPVLYKNNANSTLASGINTSVTSITLASGGGANFPAITGLGFFYATLLNISNGAFEIVKVTARNTDTLTIVRAQEGTSALAFSAGDRVELRITAALLDQIKTDSNEAKRFTNVDFNTINSGNGFTGFTNYLPTGGAYNQPTAAAEGNDFHVLQWGAYDPTGVDTNAWGAQMVVNFYDDRVWFRRQSGNAWQGWRQFLHDSNFGNYALPLTGGTLTGSLLVRGTGAASVLQLSVAGSTIWSLGVGNSSGEYFNLNADFGSLTVSKYNGSVTTPGQYYAGTSNLVLNAGNYSSYALPLSGGTLTGDLQLGGNYLRLDQLNVRSWNMRATGGNLDLLSGDGSGAFRYNGNTILNAANYVDYAFRAVTKEGGITAPAGGLDAAVQGYASYDGYGAAVPNYPNGQWWVGAFTGGYSVRGVQIAGGYADAELYFRKGNATWQAWQRIVTFSNAAGVYLRALGVPDYGNWNDYGNNFPQSVHQIYQEHFNTGLNTGSSNFPTNTSYQYGTLINFSAGSSARSQLFISHQLNNMLFRGGWDGSSWTTWNRVITDQNYSSYALPVTGGSVSGTTTFRDGVLRVITGSISASDATRGLMFDGNYENGLYRHRWRKRDDGGGLPLYLDYSHSTVNAFTAIARFGGGGTYREFEVYGALDASGTLTQANNQVLHAANYTNYTLPRGGSWYGTNTPGTRWGGFAFNGGEIVFGQDLPNANQAGILIDGCYIAAEGNGFWSLPDGNWNARRGMYFDGTWLNFTTNTPNALFTRASANANRGRADLHWNYLGGNTDYDGNYFSPWYLLFEYTDDAYSFFVDIDISANGDPNYGYMGVYNLNITRHGNIGSEIRMVAVRHVGGRENMLSFFMYNRKLYVAGNYLWGNGTSFRVNAWDVSGSGASTPCTYLGRAANVPNFDGTKVLSGQGMLYGSGGAAAPTDFPSSFNA